MKKFYTEKWWDRKEQAYTEIINALYDMIQFYKVYKEDYGQDDFISDERATDLRQKYSDGIRKLYRATDLATLYVSEEAVNVLVKLRNREILDQRSNPLWEVYELEYKYYNQSLTQLLIIAKKDLKK
ncbi:hypothetical protein NCU84_18885 [Acinetobacter baumannii]|nr:hypothetical protein [Acinetobacter baumannii]MCW1290993.1 hypothetical protein [Acinetobacter baumannii]MCZ3313338.1 hypothetical protein [Acinetobacter baumannii]MCZ7503971.1 hypothetical protein [Acinetobacter baumannii]MCZ7507701.1 hypothetical protein [Acinetobacter baumannii]MDC4659262.1 hypothetical protein [Acinetobacter baumannii]